MAQQHPTADQQPTADPAAAGFASSSFSIHGGVQALVAGLCCGDDHPVLHRRLADKAWSVLLDLDPANVAGLPEVAPDDRPAANARAAEQACASLVAQQRGPETQQLRQLLQAYAAVPGGQQQQAVLSLVLALQGSCPRAVPVMTSLPPLGSSAIQQLEQRAASAAAARDEPGGANGSSSSGSTTRSWLSPAAAALDLLQAVPLDASATTQPPGLSAATRQPAAASAHDCKQQRTLGPLVDLVNRSMLLASRDSCLKQPLRLQALQLGSSKPGASAARRSSSSNDTGNIRKSSSSAADAASRGGSAVSAAATVAEAATAALAGVEPGVLPLMALASAQPSKSHHLGGLRGSSLQDDSSSRRSTQAGERQPSLAIRYTALSRQPSSSSGGGGCFSRRSTVDSSGGAPDSTATGMPVGKQQPAQPRHDTGACRDQGTPPPAAAAAVLDAMSNASAEGELVSVACLAVQGVWAAVGQLWQLAVGSEPGGVHHRRCGLSRPPAQQQLLMQLLHIAELRLRLQAFVQHFEGECSSGGSSSSSQQQEQQPIFTGFLAAVKQLLDMHGAALQALHLQMRQQQQQQQQQQRGNAAADSGSRRRHTAPPTLLQLSAALRGVAAQLGHLAELCWCSVGEFLEQRLYVSSSAEGAAAADALASLAGHPLGQGASSSRMLAAVLQAQARRSSSTGGGGSGSSGGFSTRGSGSAAAGPGVVAAVVAVAAAAHESALPWPARQAGGWCAALGWAPSTWQLRRCYLQGHALLNHLYVGVLQAPPEAAPLLRHVFAAAVQPVLHVLRGWAFLPDTAAAEAAAAAAAAATTANMGHQQQGGSSSGGSAVAAAAAAASERRLLQAWQAACERTPACPSFLAPLQGAVAVAGAQLQLLQLLGGAGQQLAARLGVLAELEQQELREVLATDSQRQAGGASDGQAGSSMVLFLANAGWSYLPFNLSMGQLRQCAAVIADYEAARQAELSRLLAALAGQRAAGEAAAQAAAAARADAREAAEAQRQQLQAEAAARRRARQQRLLAEQQAQLAELAARRAASRVATLSLERSLLHQAAVAEHEEALQQLQHELAQGGILPPGIAVPPAAAAAAGGGASAFAAAAAAATAVADAPEPAAEGEQGWGSDAEPLELGSIAVEVAAAAAEGGADAAGAAAPQHARAKWGRPPTGADLGPAAGRPSGRAGALAVVGSAAEAAAAEMPAAGRRTNSQPRILLPGMTGRPLSGGSSGGGGSSSGGSSPVVAHPVHHARSRSSSHAGGEDGSGGAWPGSSILGGLGAAGSRAGRSSGGGAPFQPRGKWGMPVVPGPAAGTASFGGSSTGVGGMQQQQRVSDSGGGELQRPLSARRLSEQGYAAFMRAAPGLEEQQQVLGAAEQPGDSGHPTSAVAPAPPQQQQQCDMLLLDWLLHQQGAVTAGARSAAVRAALPSAAPAAGDGGGTTHSRVTTTAASSASTADDASAPIMATLEVLCCQPLLAQQRLTTAACWTLLLQQHQLLARLAAIQGLFFQQQGDWVQLLCDGLEGRLQAHQQQQSKRRGDAAELSPVMLVQLLEASVQQSCLAAAPEAERLSLKADVSRQLPGWSSSSGGGAAAASASDTLVLAYDVPWPVSLLLGPQQLSAYADIFSVLLRLRRLQQQLCKQWQPLNSRPGSTSTSSRRPGMAAAGSGGGSSRRRAMWQQAAPEQRHVATAEEEGGEQRRLQVLGLSRLQTLRQWHALALASIESLLGHMSGELCGGLLARFQDAIASQPVSLPVMADRHARLLAAARQLCLLPPVAAGSGPVSSGSAVGGLAAVVYQLVQCGWALQAAVDELLLALHEQQAVGSGEAGSKHVRATGRPGFREGGAARGLAALLAAGDDGDGDGDGGEDAESLWGALADAGEGLEGTLARLRKHLRKSSASGGTLSGLAARLGVVQVVE